MRMIPTFKDFVKIKVPQEQDNNFLSKEDKELIEKLNEDSVRKWESWAKRKIRNVQIKNFLLISVPTIIWIFLVFVLIPGSIEERTLVTILKGLLGIPIPGLFFILTLVKLNDRNRLIDYLEEPEVVVLEGVEEIDFERIKWNLRN